jgi:hypothetical protein
MSLKKLTLICVWIMRSSSFGTSGLWEDGFADTRAGLRASDREELVDKLRKYGACRWRNASVFFFARKHLLDRAGSETFMVAAVRAVVRVWNRVQSKALRKKVSVKSKRVDLCLDPWSDQSVYCYLRSSFCIITNYYYTARSTFAPCSVIQHHIAIPTTRRRAI